MILRAICKLLRLGTVACIRFISYSCCQRRVAFLIHTILQEMFDHDLSPPRSGRISSSSSSPDSLYKSSTDSSRALSFSPDSSCASSVFKSFATPLPKLLIDEDSDNEMESSFASVIDKKPPSVKKLNRSKSRFSDFAFNSPLNTTGVSSPHYNAKENESRNCRPESPSPITTPPHKRLRALQINDISNICQSPILQGCRSPLRSRKFSPRASLFSSNSAKKHIRSPANLKKKPLANPFTPNRTPNNKSSCRPSISDSGFADESWLLDIEKHNDSDMDTEQKLALQEMSTSRYKEEFCEECVLGSGEFGTVFKCINKLDGCTYAIKKSRDPVAGSTFERRARNEVYAHAVLGKHSHVVRYYSAWAENGHLYIQNEFCNGGSLAEEIAIHQKRGTRFTEAELKDILKQVSHGLKYIHAQQLAHMDIKPANIFIHYNAQILQSPESGIEDDSSDSELNDRITYKIGDFGHVTSLNSDELEEGDCRYLPKEILNDDFSNLSKADIFALGLSIYQAATLTDLPKNGDQWHEIRAGSLPNMRGCSIALNNIVKKMIHPDANERPSAAVLASHPELCPTALKSRKELARQLNEERIKNEFLAKQLKAVQENAEMKSFAMPVSGNRPNTRAHRFLGIKVNRSKSLTNF